MKSSIFSTSHQVAYLSFLLLFGIMMMTDFHPDKINVIEYIVYAYILSLFCEEIRQVSPLNYRISVKHMCTLVQK